MNPHELNLAILILVLLPVWAIVFWQYLPDVKDVGNFINAGWAGIQERLANSTYPLWPFGGA